MTHAPIILGLVAVAVGLAAGASPAAQTSGRGAEIVATVRSAPVVDTLLAPPIVAVGTLVPEDEVALGFKVGGAVATLGVDEGDVVRAGQVLATVAPEETDAAVAQARAAAE